MTSREAREVRVEVPLFLAAEALAEVAALAAALVAVLVVVAAPEVVFSEPISRRELKIEN